MIKVLFFGMIAEKVGQHALEMPAGESLAKIIQEIGCEDFKPLLVAVNQVQTQDMNYIVQDGDEVALMPPFSGG